MNVLDTMLRGKSITAGRHISDAVKQQLSDLPRLNLRSSQDAASLFTVGCGRPRARGGATRPPTYLTGLPRVAQLRRFCRF